MSAPERRAMVERPSADLSVRRQCVLRNLARSGGRLGEAAIRDFPDQFSPTSPTGVLGGVERIEIAWARGQRSALRGHGVHATLASFGAMIFGGGCAESASLRRCSRSR